MYKRLWLAIVLLTEISCMTTAPKEPHSTPMEKKLEKHGHVRTDNYFWLKNREDKNVVQYLENENAYTALTLKPYEKIEHQIFEEMKSRVIEDESTVPVQRGGFEYYSQFTPGKQYPVYLRKSISDGKETVLLDINHEATGQSFYESSGPIMSNDHNLMAYAYDNQGRRFYTIQVKDLRTQEVLPFKIENAKANIIWSKDNRYFFYTQSDPETLRTYKVYRYDLREKKSTLLFEEKDETYEVYIYQNLAKNYVFIISNSTLTTEIKYLDTSKPLSNFETFLKREQGHEYEVYDGGDRFYIRSNWQAPNFRLFETPLNKINKTAWKEIIPHKKDYYLEEVAVFKDYLVVSGKFEGLDQLLVINRQTKKEYPIPFNDKAYTAEADAQSDYNSHVFRYVFESMRQPEQTFDFNLKTQEKVLKKERQIPNFNPALYKTERIWISARDGRKVPVSLLMKIDQKQDGTAPVLTYGYGSYGVSMTPWYSQTVFSLIDRGFVYAVIHVRGGAELGRYWYEEGRTTNKMNTFTDYIDATEALVNLKIVDRNKIFAMGGSAGGLLMGAIMNMRPDLYKGIIAQVPFVDVLTTMLDDSIPLTTGEYDEWGNPNEKKFYDYILQYSPYDNVRKANYPHLLVTTGFHDSQVQYWEPAKWVSRLREMNTSSSKILLKTDMDSGHGGSSGRYQKLKEKALEFTFILMTKDL
ncbi:MAG: S9 family peptidase [Bdellovibrionaceae bacterium]|nr:S9 family peptidase [Pseudobdellovibrionaceae bacterium]